MTAWIFKYSNISIEFHKNACIFYISLKLLQTSLLEFLNILIKFRPFGLLEFPNVRVYFHQSWPFEFSECIIWISSDIVARIFEILNLFSSELTAWVSEYSNSLVLFYFRCIRLDFLNLQIYSNKNSLPEFSNI